MSVRAAHALDGLEDDEEQLMHSLGEPSNTQRISSKHKKDKGKERAKDRELQRLLLYEERETRHLRATLKETIQRLESEMLRADKAEVKTREAIARANAAESNRQHLASEAAKVNEELRLYKIQYANIQKELERAQTEYDRMVESKRAAEDIASEAKHEVRRISMEREVERARAEGRREGLDEGYRRGMQEGRDEGQLEEQQRATEAYERVLGSTQGPPIQSLTRFGEEYFNNAPTSRVHTVRSGRAPVRRPDPTPIARRSAGGVPDVAPIVDNLPIRTVATPVIQSEVGRQVRDSNLNARPTSIRNAPASPVFHGTNIDPAFIPSSDDGRIWVPPPHEIDPNPALSPSLSTTNLIDSQRMLDEEGDYNFNGAPPLQISYQLSRSSHVLDGVASPPSTSSTSTHVSNFTIVRGTTDFLNQDTSLGGASRNLPYRKAASPGLSVIPEGSNVDASSPDFTRRAQNIDRDAPPLSGPDRNWSAVAGRWVDHPDDRSTPRDGLRYSDPEVADEFNHMRNEYQSSPGTGPPRTRPGATRPHPLAATVEDLPEDPVSNMINSEIQRKRASLASSRTFDGSPGRVTPSTGHRRPSNPAEVVLTPALRNQNQSRISSGVEPLPEISILPPSRSPSFKEVSNQETPKASPVIPPSIIHPPHIRSPSPSFPRSPNNLVQAVTGPSSPSSSRPIPTRDMGFFVPSPDPGQAHPFEVERAATPRTNRTTKPSRLQYTGGSERSSIPNAVNSFTGIGVGRIPSPFNAHSLPGGIESRILAPAPQRPRPSSIHTSESGSPNSNNVILPDTMARHRRIASESSSNSVDVDFRPGSRQSVTRDFGGLQRSRSERVASLSSPRGNTGQSYATASIPADVLYPSNHPPRTGRMPKSILKNTQTPVANTFNLSSTNAGPSTGPGSGYRPGAGMSPVPSIRSMDPPPPQYKAAPTPENVVYPRSPVAPVEPLTTFVPSPMVPQRSPAVRSLAVHRNPITGSPVRSRSGTPVNGVRIELSTESDDDESDDDEDEEDDGPVYPSTGPPIGNLNASRTPGRTPGRQGLTLTQQWMSIPLPSSAAPGTAPLPISTAPSVRSLGGGQTGPWHPSQHFGGSGSQRPSPASRSPQLPTFSGTPLRPWGL